MCWYNILYNTRDCDMTYRIYLPRVEPVQVKNKNKCYTPNTEASYMHSTTICFVFFVNTDCKHVEADAIVCRAASVSFVWFLYESHQNIILALFTGLIQLFNLQPELGVFTEAV